MPPGSEMLTYLGHAAVGQWLALPWHRQELADVDDIFQYEMGKSMDGVESLDSGCSSATD